MAAKPPTRDLELLATVGRFRMLTRPQAKRWLFPDVTEPIVTRAVSRLAESGLLGVERLHGNGMQILWLTRKGRDVVVDQGVVAADLFPATGPAAAKDFAHTVAIADAAIWLMTRGLPPDELLPAWTLQRFFAGKLAVVPDLLALWRPEGATRGATLAVEVDLGTESLGSVFLPKLLELGRVLLAWFPASMVQVLLLVPGARRQASLRKALTGIAVPVVVELLAITEPLTPPVKSI